MAQTPKVSSGVQELIGRLRDDGVKAGEAESERLTREARTRAQEIVNDAKAKAKTLVDDARAEIEAERAAAHEAIQLAVRDTKLKLGGELKGFFEAQVRRLVAMQLEDRDFLRQLILTIAGSATSELNEGQPLELQLPEDLFEQAETRTEFSTEGKERLRHFLLAISNEMLREGVELKPSSSVGGGIRVRLVEDDLEIDLSDEAISDLLLQHLTPRFRAVVQGVG
jgi:V/A-type H+-transporting ATPase subunit E